MAWENLIAFLEFLAFRTSIVLVVDTGMNFSSANQQKHVFFHHEVCWLWQLSNQVAIS